MTETKVIEAVQGVRQPAMEPNEFRILEEGQQFLAIDHALKAGGTAVGRYKLIPKGMVGIVHDDQSAVSVVWADCQAVRRARTRLTTLNGKRFIQRDRDRTEDDDFKINVAHHMTSNQEAMPMYTPEGKVAGWVIQNKFE